jgi:hypothetical protein
MWRAARMLTSRARGTVVPRAGLAYNPRYVHTAGAVATFGQGRDNRRGQGL